MRHAVSGSRVADRDGSPLAKLAACRKLGASDRLWGRAGRVGDDFVFVGMSDRMLLYGAGAFVGSATPSAYAAGAPSAVAAANGTPIGTTSRLQQLLDGATPVNDSERQLLRQAETVLAGTVRAVNGLAAEAVRQARLGRDLYGNPLGGTEDHAFEQRVLQLVNAERARAGLPALGYQRQLDQASETHARHMASVGRMAHEGIGDGDPGSRILATGFNRSWGENVATGQVSPEQVVAEWMASPGHRRNIMDPQYRYLGVSYEVAANGRTYWAQSFGA